MCATGRDNGDKMQIRWLGHACFHVRMGEKEIITDPAPPKTGYIIPEQRADIVTVSHQHWDHNYLPLVQGSPRVFDQAGTFVLEGLTITGLPSYHDPKKGKERGSNLIYKVEGPEGSWAHLGDLGTKPEPQVVQQLKGLDVLMVPVGGVYTIDADEAFDLCTDLNPRIIIPMHFKTPVLSFEVDPVEKFLMKFPRVQKLPQLDCRYISDSQPVVVVLDY